VGRAGFAPTYDWLVYAKGGYVAGRIQPILRISSREHEHRYGPHQT
jgi:hypothetical protein